MSVNSKKSVKNEDYMELEWQRILQKKKEDFDKKYAKAEGETSSLSRWERIRTLGTGGSKKKAKEECRERKLETKEMKKGKDKGK